MNTHGIPSLTKDVLRRSMRDALRAVPAAQREGWSATIRQWLTCEDSWVPRTGGVVGLFGGIATEPDLVPLIAWLADRGVRAAFFSINGEMMRPHLVTSPTDLHAGKMGVLEPVVSVCEPMDVEELDVVLLPGVAFSRVSGARLGRGKGHYDRVLERLPVETLRIGVCFHLQLHDEVPLEAHDRHVQALVTEQGWLRIVD
jgi:5-formyltetrahydrofolate cyclo-ligase